jgi:hypothetical protein
LIDLRHHDSELREAFQTEWVRVPEAARYLALDEATLRRWIEQDQVVHGYDDGRIVVRWDRLIARTEFKRALRRKYWMPRTISG